MKCDIVNDIKLQVNLVMSNLPISNTQPMSKWLSIPEYFPFIALYFDLAYVKLGYHEKSAISKQFFTPKVNFPFGHHCLYRSGQKVKRSEWQTK